MKKQWGNHFNIDEGRVGTLFRLMKVIGWRLVKREFAQ